MLPPSVLFNVATIGQTVVFCAYPIRLMTGAGVNQRERDQPIHVCKRRDLHHLMQLRIRARHLGFGSIFALKDCRSRTCTRGMMDIHILMAERRRIAEEFRSKLTQLSKLRNELVDARTDEGRCYLYAAVDEQSAAFRELG